LSASEVARGTRTGRLPFPVAVGLATWLFVGATAALAAVLLPGGAESATLRDQLGPLGDALAPWYQFDGPFYLRIVENGYSGGAESAFFPLYPLVVWLASGLGASLGAELIAACVVSAGSFVAALTVFHRLAELELPPAQARVAVLLLATFPTAFFFFAPYTESLFLALTVGGFYAARTGHWAWAGVLAAGASATRNSGIVLLVPLVLLYLYGPRSGGERIAGARGWRPRYRVRRNVLWLALAPAGLAAFCLHLAFVADDPLAFLSAQDDFHFRSFWGPFGGIVAAFLAVVEGVRELLPGASVIPTDLPQYGATPTSSAIQRILFFVFLIGVLVAVAGTLRRLSGAYGAYVVAALFLPLSYPAEAQPLMSLPRFVVVLFPLFVWAAVLVERRRWTRWVVPASAAGLAFLTAAMATRHFVA
jgi:hypothetical protein